MTARRRWKPPRVMYDHYSYAISVTTTTSRPVHAPYVLLPDKIVSTNHTAYRSPLSRRKATVSLVRSIGDRNSGRGGVLSITGLPAGSHPNDSVQSLVDGLLITVLGIFVVVAIVVAVTLARRRRRVVAEPRSHDDYDDCMELGEFVTELDDTETTQVQGTSSPAGWSVDDTQDNVQVFGDITSLTPLCARSISSEASIESTPSDASVNWKILPV